jgi:hypothetical protein
VRGQSPFQPLLNAPRTPRIQHPRALSMQRVSVAFHPSPRPLSPSRGEGSPRTFNTPKPTPIPLSPVGERGRGEGAIPLPTPPQRPQDTANPASSRTVDAACLSCVSPLTPAPSPLPGARGARAPLTPPNPHQSPLSPVGGEGSVVRGQSPFQPLLNAPRTPRIQHPRALSDAACLSCVSPLTPAPSPLPGARGARAPLTPPNPHQSPLSPSGRGVGVRGQSPFQPLLNAPRTPRIQHPRALSMQRVSVAFHPSPPPPLPFQGRGEPAHL